MFMFKDMVSSLTQVAVIMLLHQRTGTIRTAEIWTLGQYINCSFGQIEQIESNKNQITFLH